MTDSVAACRCVKGAGGGGGGGREKEAPGWGCGLCKQNTHLIFFYHNTDRNITVAKKEYNVFSVIFTKGYVIGLNLSLSFFFFLVILSESVLE